jgi:hypothetical protein
MYGSEQSQKLADCSCFVITPSDNIKSAGSLAKSIKNAQKRGITQAHIKIEMPLK